MQQGRAVPKAGPAGAGGVESLTPALEKLPGGRALSRAVVPDQYILGPGDGLTVNLWGEYEDLYEVRVTPDGKISLPTLGDLKVKGLSLAQAEALIAAEVKKYYRNVKSGLSLTSLRAFEVSVLGAVQLPGTYLATPVKRVSDLVTEAGGVLPGGSRRHIQVRRDGKVVETADLTAFVRRGDESTNPYLQDTDMIFVPPMGMMIVSVVTNEVMVAAQSGQVIENSTPSNIEMKEGERIADLLAEVGSVSPWWNLEAIYVVRESKIPAGTMKIPVDARRLLFENDETQNIEMENGDQVFIPSNVRRVFVNGLVRTGGAFSYVPNRTAEEYLGLAGGVSLTASLDRSTIRRADGSVEPFRGNTVLLNGDAIQVEQKYFATPSDYVGVIGGLTSLVFSAFAFLTTLK
jgi:protein involved in polysaccharide export with SLBB domain